MATERQSPDAVASSTNLSGGVTDIQDDPDSPDANWMVATGNNVNTDVRVTFPTSTGDPTVGADLQGFRARVRQFDTNQAGLPEARVELWENGVLIRAGSEITVGRPSDSIVSLDWNANELGTADGSLVECKVVGTKSGGSPSSRNTVDVGAVEWNVDYTVGVAVVGGAASVSGAGAVSAASLLEVIASAALSGVGSVSAASLIQVIAASVATGTGSVTTAEFLLILSAANVAGVGAVTAVGQVVTPAIEGAAVMAGAGSVGATSVVRVFAAAAVSGTGSVSVVGQLVIPLSAAIAGGGSFASSGLLVIFAAAASAGIGSLTATAAAAVADTGLVGSSATLRTWST